MGCLLASKNGVGFTNGRLRQLGTKYCEKLTGKVNDKAVAAFNFSIRLQRPRIDSLGRRINDGRKFKHPAR